MLIDIYIIAFYISKITINFNEFHIFVNNSFNNNNLEF